MAGDPSAERVSRMSVGVIVRRCRGATRWSRWSWKAVAVHAGTGPGGWTEMRRDGDTVDYHAATVLLELHRAETEGYLVALNGHPPAVNVIMRPDPSAADGRPMVIAVTASAYTAQDHADNGEDIVEPVPLDEMLGNWISKFCERHHREEAFVKRKRRPWQDEGGEGGTGDARIRQSADVYRAPGRSCRKDDRA